MSNHGVEQQDGPAGLEIVGTAQTVPVRIHPQQREAMRQDGDQTLLSTKYRRLDREGTRASTGSNETGNRFLFVDSSSSSQRPRSDQRAINAHIQQTAHRNRRQAAVQRLRGIGTANIGRYRREAQLQLRPTEQRPSSDQTQLEHSVAVTRASSVSLEQRNLPGLNSSSISPPEIESAEVQQQLDRLRHYSTIRGSEVDQAFRQQEEDDEREALQVIQNTQLEDHGSATEASSVRMMLKQILQRLDAGNASHAIHGRAGNNVLHNTVLDPFGVSSVQVTPSMDSVLRHCK